MSTRFLVCVLVTNKLLLGDIWRPAEDKSSISLHQEDAETLEKVSNHLSILTPCMTGQLPGQPGDVGLGVAVPAAQCLHG